MFCQKSRQCALTALIELLESARQPFDTKVSVSGISLPSRCQRHGPSVRLTRVPKANRAARRLGWCSPRPCSPEGRLPSTWHGLARRAEDCLALLATCQDKTGSWKPARPKMPFLDGKRPQCAVQRCQKPKCFRHCFSLPDLLALRDRRSRHVARLHPNTCRRQILPRLQCGRHERGNEAENNVNLHVDLGSARPAMDTRGAAGTAAGA